ncbi:BTB/POZ domain-containing protein KCTD11 [Protopterus annectens]|uniref:BTB/POZ domain-containing protein KCTD11 n=1 Tax=Protopterus annectens TaxID=7888 RepID=UPI001CF97194|nr:BTB/POZ domain-containing protein KCTD11 [Protopterus annectens]
MGSDQATIDSVITLNVGGSLYTTTLETLTKYPNSMLGVMFKGQLPTMTDSHGRYFIDRDGKAFRYILNYLRTSFLDLPEDYSETELLKREADFYQIQSLLQEISLWESQKLKARQNAILHFDSISDSRLLHFNLKKEPGNYELSNCIIQLITVNLFCTDYAVVQLLCNSFVYGDEEPQHAHDCENHLMLQWAPRPTELPLHQYQKHKFRPLKVYPDGKEVLSISDFVKELLMFVVKQGFQVDTLFPDPADILNCHSLRFVRYGSHHVLQ